MDFVNLSDYADIFSGFAFKSSDLTSDGIPVIKIGNIQDKQVLSGCKDYLPKALMLGKHKKYVLQRDDFLIAMTGAGSVGKTGKMQTVDDTYLVNQRVAIVRAKSDSCDPRFLFYVVSQDKYERELYGLGLGAGQPNVSASQIGNLKIPKFSLNKQEQIAEILSAYDDLIENNQRRIRLLEDMAQSLYREWFVHFRFPGHKKTKMTDSSLGPIPQGWEIRELKQCVRFIKDTTKRQDLEPHYKYLPIDCLPRKCLSVSEYRPLEEAQSSLILFKREDILFGAMRPYFHKVVIAPFDGVTRATCFVFRPLSEEYRCWSLLRLFEDETVDYANAHSKGATIPYASWEDGMARMPVVFPPSEIVQKFEEAISSSIDWIINAHHRQENLKRARDLLLPKLISGEIDLSATVSGIEEAA